MLPGIGKVDRAAFDKIIFPRLGRKDVTVRLGPQHGVDAAVVDLPDGSVMLVAEDPAFVTPVTMPYFGWATVHICASDVAVLGVKPRYMTICLLLSTGIDEAALSHIWQQIDKECQKLGIAIIGGHTGVYPGIAYPLNGGCTVIGLGSREQLTLANNAGIGDRVIITEARPSRRPAASSTRRRKSLQHATAPNLLSGKSGVSLIPPWSKTQ
jgi:hydrogenase expression/formation protein HypE